MRHINPSQLASGQSTAPPSLATVIGSISPTQLDSLDPIALPIGARELNVLAESERIERVIAASLAGEGECALVDVDSIPPYPNLSDLVRGVPDHMTLAQLVNEIEADPFRAAVRWWNVETFARQLHDRVTRLESREKLRGTY